MFKRGISVIISTLLLIVIVMSLAAIYFLWTRVIISNTQSGASAQKSCEKVQFAANDFCLGTYSLLNSEGSSTTVKNIKFSVRNAASDQNISGFAVSLVDRGGNDYLLSTLPTSEAVAADSLQLSTGWIQMNLGDIKSIILQPQINSSGNLITCNSQQMEVPWSEVGTC